MKVSRIIRCGIAFGTFYIGALIMTCGPFLLLYFIPFKKQEKQAYARSLIRFLFRSFIALMRFLGLIYKPIIKGSPNEINEPCIYAANHPSLIDVVLLASALPDATCIVKHGHWKSFFLGSVMRTAGYIPNADGPKLLRACQEAFDRGQSLIIFPEGTRSSEEGMRSFKRGTARLLAGSKAAIMPIIITCKPRALMKHQKWHEIPNEKIQLSMHFLDRMKIPDIIKSETIMPKKVRRLTSYLEKYFQEQIVIHCASHPQSED